MSQRRWFGARAIARGGMPRVAAAPSRGGRAAHRRTGRGGQRHGTITGRDRILAMRRLLAGWGWTLAMALAALLYTWIARPSVVRPVPPLPPGFGPTIDMPWAMTLVPETGRIFVLSNTCNSCLATYTDILTVLDSRGGAVVASRAVDSYQSYSADNPTQPPVDAHDGRVLLGYADKVEEYDARSGRLLRTDPPGVLAQAADTPHRAPVRPPADPHGLRGPGHARRHHAGGAPPHPARPGGRLRGHANPPHGHPVPHALRAAPRTAGARAAQSRERRGASHRPPAPVAGTGHGDGGEWAGRRSHGARGPTLRRGRVPPRGRHLRHAGRYRPWRAADPGRCHGRHGPWAAAAGRPPPGARRRAAAAALRAHRRRRGRGTGGHHRRHHRRRARRRRAARLAGGGRGHRRADRPATAAELPAGRIVRRYRPGLPPPAGPHRNSSTRSPAPSSGRSWRAATGSRRSRPIRAPGGSMWRTAARRGISIRTWRGRAGCTTCCRSCRAAPRSGRW